MKEGDVDEVVTIFGPDGKELVDSSDPVGGPPQPRGLHRRGGRTLAAGGRGRTEDARRRQRGVAVPDPAREGRRTSGDSTRRRARKKSSRGASGATSWPRSDLPHLRRRAAALRAGRARRQDRRACYAHAFRSDPGRQNGLYWPARTGRAAQPAWASSSPRPRRKGGKLRLSRARPPPFHGYYFRILTAQGAAAPAAPATTSSAAR